jgi:hypothetical protein
MDFDWDEDKRQTNLAKHGIDFVRAKEIWEAPVLEIPSPQTHHAEARYLALGVVDGEVIAVVFTWRRRIRRIISARKARNNEKALCEIAFGEKGTFIILNPGSSTRLARRRTSPGNRLPAAKIHRMNLAGTWACYSRLTSRRNVERRNAPILTPQRPREFGASFSAGEDLVQ